MSTIDTLVSKLRYFSGKILMVPVLAASLMGYACSSETPGGSRPGISMNYVSDAGSDLALITDMGSNEKLPSYEASDAGLPDRGSDLNSISDAGSDLGLITDAGRDQGLPFDGKSDAALTDVGNDLSFITDAEVDAGVDAGADAFPYGEELTVRVNFLEFSTDRTSLAGNDYLFDIEIRSEEREECRAQGRTGHSRYIEPEYLDLSLPRNCLEEATQINIFAYWHLSDILIDIDPERSHGRCLQLSIINPDGCYLALDYSIGSTLEGQVDGNDDGFLLDPFDGLLRYRIETR